MKHILKCKKCKEYTMLLEHCGTKSSPIKPAKYSPEDRYGEYRRKVLKEDLIQKDLI